MFKGLLAAAAALCAVQFSVQVQAQDCSRPVGSLPDPIRRAGVSDAKIPLEHIIVIMQENHSFDSYFGKLSQPQFYGGQIDGWQPWLSNPNGSGGVQKTFHQTTLCPADPDHTWDGEHKSWNNGWLDGFVKTNGANVMGYFDQSDIPYYYALANTFAVADRYFCSSLTQTFPNRFYLLTGTSFGHTLNDLPTTKAGFTQKTIFEQLNNYGISWKYYASNPLYISLFADFAAKNEPHIDSSLGFQMDLNGHSLPHVVFIDSDWTDGQDEHPEGDIQMGQQFVATKIKELMNSIYWKDSVLFLTYDENGGFYDHVEPPRACLPDNIAPVLGSNKIPGKFDRYGFRVPFVAVGPYVKHHYVSHRVYDHTSILKFIEHKYNLPALTARDANADGLMDLFDFRHPILKADLPDATIDPGRQCQ